MADEKITNTGYVDVTTTDNKEMTEKVGVVPVTSHEPYDAVSHNINIGEFSANPAVRTISCTRLYADPLKPRGKHDQNSLNAELLEEEPLDLYKPFPITEDIVIEDNILTIRAIFVGVILGSLVNASNLYLGR